MDVIDARVRKCIDETSIIDRKMRTRTLKYEKYIISLSDNHPFERDEFVKVLRKVDFDKIGEIIKELKKERNQLKNQIDELKVLSENQKNYINMLENNKSSKGIFKDLIKI
ncbi:MAG: hypothetical protein ACPK7O_00360 [Methanobacterium sp.]